MLLLARKETILYTRWLGECPASALSDEAHSLYRSQAFLGSTPVVRFFGGAGINFVRLHDLAYKEGTYPPAEGLFKTFIKSSHGNEMKNKAILHANLHRAKRRAETYANPSWWTLKRWSEFMWFTHIVAIGKRAALRLMSSGLRPTERI